MPKHVHCDLIKAWADGAEIQYKHPQTKEWRLIYDPSWSEQYEYRIKPKTKVIKYRTYLWLSPITKVYQIFTSSGSEDDISSRENLNGFIKWLGDLQEVEVEDV